MATSFLQKLKLGFRGWSRRRAEEAARRDAEFLERATPWAKPAAPQPRAAVPSERPRTRFDLEGLQVAYLDDSGRISHYLDLQSGEVVDVPEGDVTSKHDIDVAPARYRRIPQRNAESERHDRIDFTKTIEKPEVRESLERALERGEEFRKALALDRGAERSWYNFKNRRAAEAIERWLRELSS